MREAAGQNTAGSGVGPDPLLGTVLNGKYHIHKSIARGGMGRIYYATQAPLDRPVALKVVEADAVNEQESQFLKRFLQEASILAKLQHPNVVTLFDYGRVDGQVERFFIAMEYLAGDTLGQRLKARNVLPVFEVLSIFRQIARGLREAHARGIVHRDLKPSNVILVPQGDGGELVKIVDFGIGKVVETGEQAFKQDLTQEGMMVGTPRYMAPEQFEGIVSPASDLYALGTIVFQALTGSLPFNGSTLPEFMVAKFAHPIPRMHDVNPQCEATENLEALVNRLLERKPETRMTLDELFQHLPVVEEEIYGASGARFALSGHQVSMPTSRRNSMSSSLQVTGPHQPDLRVPYTVVAPAPSLRVGVAGSGPHPSQRSYTPHPMSRPSDEQPPKKAPVLPIVVVVLLFGLIAGVVFLLRERNAGQTSRLATGSTSPQASDPRGGNETSFTLSIDSTPTGATVIEGDHALGSTPIGIVVDRTSVASGPRTFLLKKDGFVTGTVVQGSTSDTNVKTVVALAPEPTGAVKSPKLGTTRGTTPPQPLVKPPPPPGPSDTDIRLKR